MLDRVRRWGLAATLAVLSGCATHAHAYANQITQRDVEVLEAPLHKLSDLLPTITSSAKEAQAAGIDAACLTEVHGSVQLTIAVLSGLNGILTMAALVKHPDDEKIALLLADRSLGPAVDILENNIATLTTIVDICRRHTDVVVYARKALLVFSEANRALSHIKTRSTAR